MVDVAGGLVIAAPTRLSISRETSTIHARPRARVLDPGSPILTLVAAFAGWLLIRTWPPLQASVARIGVLKRRIAHRYV